MSGNRREENGLADLLGAAVGVGLGVAAVFGIGAVLMGALEEESKTMPNRSELRIGHSGAYSEEEQDDIIIAIDATPTTAGGLMIIPASKTVHYYSIDWTGTFDFNNHGPDKFEMVNALLALNIFNDDLASYRRRGCTADVVLKVDNTFCVSPGTTYAGSRNECYRALFTEINRKLRAFPFSGQWKHISVQQDDHMRIADKLSRSNETFIMERFPGYIKLKCSYYDSYEALSEVKSKILELNYRELSSFLNH